MSEATVEELEQVLRRPRFEKYVEARSRLAFLARLVQDAELVDVRETITACRDAKDDKFLALAVAGNATTIVTGDADLLVLNPFRGIPILSPQDYLAHP